MISRAAEMEFRLILALVAISLPLIRSQGCDETYTTYTGTLSSPNYPSNYPTDTTCNYIIDVATAQSINIVFNDVQIEPGYDFLYYGLGTTPDLDNYLGVLTGITYPPPLDLGSGSVWFQFVSDDVETLTGFELVWTASDDPLPTTPPLSTIAPTKPYATPDPVLGVELYCDATSMTMIFDRSALFPATPGADEVHFIEYTNDTCIGYDYSADQIAITTDYSQCGTTLEETANYVVFKNRVIYGDPASPQLNGEIECRLSRHLQAEVNSAPFADNVQFTQVGFGNFSFDMDIYPDAGYGTPYLPGDYPIDVEIGEDVFVEARVDTNSEIDLLIDACWATDSQDPDDADQYYLISSGCAKDSTVEFYEGPGGSQRFSFGAFVFPDGDPVLYLHCQLLTCDANAADTRCKQGCISRARRDSEPDEQLELHTVSSNGPINIRHLQPEVNNVPLADNIEFTQVGFGNFSFDMDLYPDADYGTPYLPGDYPIEVEIGEDVFVEAQVDTNNEIDLFIDACWATDSQDPDDTDQYYIISSGCAKDSTVVFYEGPAGSQRFSFGAFVFPTGDPMLYLHCQLLTCDANAADTRCKQGCISRARRDSEPDEQLDLHTVSSNGPINVRYLY